MKATKSKDGLRRISIRIHERISLLDLLFVAAGHNYDTSVMIESKSKLLVKVRTVFSTYGSEWYNILEDIIQDLAKHIISNKQQYKKLVIGVFSSEEFDIALEEINRTYL